MDLSDPQGYLERETLQDFIDLFFGGPESSFSIIVMSTIDKVPNASIRGQCATKVQKDLLFGSSSLEFRITLFTPNVIEQFSLGVVFGGNTTKAASVKHALYLTLTHELRHAYQSIYHGTDQKAIQAGKYRGRASEVDARRHVDESYEAVCDFLDIRAQARQVYDPGEAYIDLLVDIMSEGADSVGQVAMTDDGLWDQAFQMSGDPDLNYRKLRERMASRGLRLSCPVG